MKMWTPIDTYHDNEIKRLEAERDAFALALARILSHLDGDCRFDHSGNCQAHFLDGPSECRVANAAALLEKLQESKHK
jgi:hypothetical protein